MKPKIAIPPLNILVVLAAVSYCTLVGCGSKEHEHGKYELSEQSKDGGVYRLNKETGEVLFITAGLSMPVEGTEVVDVATNRFISWNNLKVNQLGDVKVELKTDWRRGRLYYHFIVSPYDHILSIIKNAPKGKFSLAMQDTKGFRLFETDINLADLTPTATSDDKINLFETTASVPCDLETYQSLATWSVAPGFSAEQ